MTSIVPMIPESRQFSIRLPRPLWMGVAMLVLVVVVGGSRVGTLFYRYHQRQLAAEAIQSRGGLVFSRQGGSERIRQIVGDEWMQVFDEYYVVQFTGSHVTAADLAPLHQLEDLEIVDLQGAQVTNEGVLKLNSLMRLQRLVLAGTDVSDEGLEHLTGLPALEYLMLNTTGVTDAGLQHLKRMGSLKHLGLRDTKVTDAGVADLKLALPGLFIYR